MNEKHIEVLQQYELENRNVRRGRGAWICETDHGFKLLREYKGTVKRLEFEEEVLAFLEQQGYPYVDNYMRNKEDQLISTADDGTRFIVKNWFVDRECDSRDVGEVLKAVTQIASLHRLMREIQFREEWSMGSTLGQSPRLDMDRHNKELKRARSYIRGKRKKTEFELCVIGSFSAFYRQAEEALEGMERLEESVPDISHFLCHGDLDQHHILMGNRYIAVTEFNKMHTGIQMTDLYHFMRKIMEKHSWNLALGTAMLEAYDRILPMNRKERDCLYYLFLYPEKYWKQINFYYNANKAWIPVRNIEKLRNLEQQEENRKLFLNELKQ